MEPINISELSANLSEWPECPQCGERGILLGGKLACCVHCSFFGTAEQISATNLMKYARAKMASRGMGHRGIIAMLGGKEHPGRADLVAERSSELAQRLVHAPLFEKAQRLFEKRRDFPPQALFNYRPEDGRIENFSISTDSDLLRLKTQALKYDLVSVVTIDQIANRLFMDTHVYNSPSHRRVASYSIKNREVVWEKDWFAPQREAPASLIWQPLDWSIVVNEPGNIQPRWVGVLEVEDDINITFAVCEDMDGPPLIKTSFRDIMSVNPAKLVTHELGSAEEGIELLRGQFNDVLGRVSEPGVGKLIFNQEFSWDLDANPHAISHALRTAEFWKIYETVREQ